MYILNLVGMLGWVSYAEWPRMGYARWILESWNLGISESRNLVSEPLKSLSALSSLIPREVVSLSSSVNGAVSRGDGVLANLVNGGCTA